MPNTVTQAGAPTDVQVVPGMVVFGGFGGRTNEGRVNVDGISVGSAFNGAGVSSYIADVGNAREIAMTTSGGLGRSRRRRPVAERRAERGRQRRARHASSPPASPSGMVGSNYTQELQRPRPDDARRDAEGVGLQPRRRRADREGPPVVLLHLREEGSERDGAGHVRQRERRRPHQVDVCRRHQPPGRARRVVSHHRAPAHRRRSRRGTSSRSSGTNSSPVRRRCRAWILGRRLPQVERQRGLRRIDRRADAVGVRHRWRRRRRRTATSATACRRRSGRRR